MQSEWSVRQHYHAVKIAKQLVTTADLDVDSPKEREKHTATSPSETQQVGEGAWRSVPGLIFTLSGGIL